MDSLLKDNPGIRTVWTPGEQTRVTQSNYNQAVRHQSIIGLRAAKFLGREDTGGAGEVDLLMQHLAVQNEVSCEFLRCSKLGRTGSRCLFGST